MPPTHAPSLSLNALYPLRIIGTGILLLLLAAAGFIYVLARQKPALEGLEPLQLRLDKKTLILPSEIDEPAPPKSSVIKVIRQQPKPIKTFAVKILSPLMAERFTAPANVTLRASANNKSELESIEFFNSPSETVCQSLTNPVPFPQELKIGEVHEAPYEIMWSIPEPGIRTLVAVATYKGGEKQISRPVVIVVDPTKPYDGPEWKGWLPPYPTDQLLDQDFSIMPKPTPPPTRDSCPAIVVKSLPVPPESNTVTFQANVSGNEVPPDLTFKWNVSAGDIIKGQGTSTITVVVDKILDPRVVAAVEIGPLPGICPAFGSVSVAFEQPRWITKEFRDLLREKRALITEKQDSPIHRYIEVYGERDDCVDEERLNQAKLLRRYLIEYQGVKREDVTLVNAGQADEDSDTLLLRNVPSDESPDHSDERVSKPLTPCRNLRLASANYEPPLNRTCPDVDETVKYMTSVRLSKDTINTCPYNPRDPINTETQLTLSSSVLEGTYSNFPSFKYWADAGRILSKRPEGIWDLSEVKVQPGVYTAIAMADDGCDCTNINIQTVAVTNFCSPCLTMRRTCSSSTETRGLQFYRAEIGKFAIAEKSTFHWTTTKGTIIEGQGSPNIVIDTRGLPNGEKFLVTVAVSGLMRYCVNKVSQPAIVEEFECKLPVKFDEYGNIRFNKRRARRRPKPEEITQIEKGEDTSGRPGKGPVYNGSLRTNEKEWMKLSWTPHVKTDDAVTVKIVYNRTTESFQISEAAGDISEEMKLRKPLREWFGENYQTLGDVRLRTAGLRCDSCNHEQYQSFDNDKLEWSWPLKPEGPGTQSFNVELWVKGEPRDRHSGNPSQPAEKVWTKTDNRVAVTEPLLTRQTVYFGGGLCAVLGLGVCLRGFKIYSIGDTYNVGQAVAVGRNVSMTNTTVNQQGENNNATDGENKDV